MQRVGEEFDVAVVGSGPAGAVAALVAARGGARVALIDKAAFPRDKACGDLIGPRGVALLRDLGVGLPGATDLRDMVVVGPTGARVRLPCPDGITYPSEVLAMPRKEFDAALRKAALEAGALPFTGSVKHLRDGGVELATGRRIEADTVIGADGATSTIARLAGLVDSARVLRGFAVRTYAHAEIAEPHIIFWEPKPWRTFPGYGWIFPGVEGCANVGLGIGVSPDGHPAAAEAVRSMDSFTAYLREAGLLRAPSRDRMGGWLKMGIVGTIPARRRVLLAGDAAGLVNPLQGEGISEAMRSGRAAAEAILRSPGDPAPEYRAWLRRSYGRYQSAAAVFHRALLPRPLLVAAAGRALTSFGLTPALAGGWSIFWNDLLDGAAPGRSRTAAATAQRLGGWLTSAGETRRWFREHLA